MQITGSEIGPRASEVVRAECDAYRRTTRSHDQGRKLSKDAERRRLPLEPDLGTVGAEEDMPSAVLAGLGRNSGAFGEKLRFARSGGIGGGGTEGNAPR